MVQNDTKITNSHYTLPVHTCLGKADCAPVLYAALLMPSEHIHRLKQTFLVVRLVSQINTDN